MKLKNIRMAVATLLCLVMLLSLMAGCDNAPSASESGGLSPEDAYHQAVTSDEEEPEQLYSVVSPLGANNVEQIEMAPRLDTLDGKKIALVGGSFHAGTTHSELKRLITRDYPSATVYMFDEVGSAGTYNLFAVSNQVKQFQDKLQELEIDAVVTGNCG